MKIMGPIIYYIPVKLNLRFPFIAVVQQFGEPNDFHALLIDSLVVLDLGLEQIKHFLIELFNVFGNVPDNLRLFVLENVSVLDPLVVPGNDQFFVLVYGPVIFFRVLFGFFGLLRSRNV